MDSCRRLKTLCLNAMNGYNRPEICILRKVSRYEMVAIRMGNRAKGFSGSRLKVKTVMLYWVQTFCRVQTFCWVQTFCRVKVVEVVSLVEVEVEGKVSLRIKLVSSDWDVIWIWVFKITPGAMISSRIRCRLCLSLLVLTSV